MGQNFFLQINKSKKKKKKKRNKSQWNKNFSILDAKSFEIYGKITNLLLKMNWFILQHTISGEFLSMSVFNELKKKSVKTIALYNFQ